MDRSFPLQVLAFRGEEVEPPRPFLYIPQESSTFRSNPLLAINIDYGTNPSEKESLSLITLIIHRVNLV
jgi:hypothetical protein